MSAVDKRYAEALLEAAELNNAIDAVQAELKTIVELYDKQNEFASFFLTPEIGKEEKKAALRSIFTESESIILNFLQLLVDKDRIKNLPGIYKEYTDMADKHKKVLNLIIRSYAAIDDIQLEKLQEKYMKEFDAAAVKTTVSIEPELLGGIVVQIGDRVIDGSIKGRLNGLKDTATKMQQLKVI